MWFVMSALAAPLPLERCVETGRLSSLDHHLLSEAVEEGYADPRTALAVVDRVVGAWPTCDAAWMARSGLLNALGRREEALASLERGVGVAQGPEASRALAIALHHAGEGGTVLRDAARRGDDPLLTLLAARELPPSERPAALLEAVERHPDEVALRIEALRALDAAGRPREAIARGRAWVADRPELQAVLARIERPFVVDDTTRIQRPAEVRTLADGTEEIVVFSPGLAKRALIDRLEILGYLQTEEVDGGVRYRSERPVSPWVEVRDDGTVEVQEKGWVTPTPRSDGRTTIPVMTARKLRPDRVRVMEAISYETTVWQQSIRLEAFQGELDQRLPEQLTALWDAGTPLYGGGRLASRKARRDAIVDHWASRACTPDGDAARDVVARFLRNVVQDSEVALTPDEIVAIEARGPCEGRSLAR